MILMVVAVLMMMMIFNLVRSWWELLAGKKQLSEKSHFFSDR
jgi:hypothetical protein